MFVPSRSVPRWHLVGSGMILLAWLYLNRPALQWVYESIQQASLLNLLLLGSVAGFLLIQIGRPQSWELNGNRWRTAPLVFMLIMAIAAIALPWVLDLPQLSLTLFVLGTYAWLGCFLSPTRWNQGLAIALLVAFLLPFSLELNTGLGFPVRVLTANAVEFLLHQMQITAFSSQDIIVLENGIALVDLPCSGLKSLWTGSLFLLAATWLEKRQLGVRWLLVAIANLGLLVCANVGRVLALVVIAEGFQQPQLAEILHIPLGLIGFLAACILSWGLLRWVPPVKQSSNQIQINAITSRDADGSISFSPLLPLVLTATLIGLSLLPQPPMLPQPQLAQIAWPRTMQVTELPLTETEQQFFGQFSDTVVQKQRFQLRDLSGSMLLVSSSSWRSQHAPELCFAGNGFHVDSMTASVLNPDLPVRWIALNHGTKSATYWYQSPQKITDSFLRRIWLEISHRQRPWVMVSILFDQPLTPQDAIVGDFATTVHRLLNQGLANQDLANQDLANHNLSDQNLLSHSLSDGHRFNQRLSSPSGQGGQS